VASRRANGWKGGEQAAGIGEQARRKRRAHSGNAASRRTGDKKTGGKTASGRTGERIQANGRKGGEQRWCKWKCEVCSAAEKYEKGERERKNRDFCVNGDVAVSYGGANLPVTPLPTLISLCIIRSSTFLYPSPVPRIFIQVLCVCFEVSLRYPSAVLFLCPACFGLLFILLRIWAVARVDT
jgi:hypothetical protein